MSKPTIPVTHIVFAQGTEIKPAFVKAMVPEQRRDPENSEGYWLVNYPKDYVEKIAKQCGQTFQQLRPDTLYPK